MTKDSKTSAEVSAIMGSVASVASIALCGYNETKKGSNAISYFT